MRNFFNLMSSVLSDAFGHKAARNEILSAIDADQLYNKLKGKAEFTAICLSGGATAENTSNPTSNLGSYYPVHVRPIDIHDFILPDPCGKEYANDSILAKRIIDMHPIAYGERPPTAGERTPGFGDILFCRFLIDGPDHHGRLRGIRYTFPRAEHSYNYECANAELQSLVGKFQSFPLTLSDSLAQSPAPGINQGDPGKPTKPLPSSQINGTVIKKFEADLRALLKSKGLPFHVTDRSRTVAQQMNRIKAKYRRKGAAEVIGTYGSRGKKMVAAIKAGDTATFRALAAGSSRHLKGAAIDIRVWHYTDAQMAIVLADIKSLGGRPLVEPITGGCWANRSSSNPTRPYGIASKRCRNQHIHIDIPTNYPQNLQTVTP